VLNLPLLLLTPAFVLWILGASHPEIRIGYSFAVFVMLLVAMVGISNMLGFVGHQLMHNVNKLAYSRGCSPTTGHFFALIAEFFFGCVPDLAVFINIMLKITEEDHGHHRRLIHDGIVGVILACLPLMLGLCVLLAGRKGGSLKLAWSVNEVCKFTAFGVLLLLAPRGIQLVLLVVAHSPAAAVI